VRIESVRFDASGNAAIAVSGGVFFILPKARIDEFAEIAAAAWGLEPGCAPDFLSGLPAAAPEFGEEDNAYRFLVLADETARALRKAVELCARAEQSSGGLSIKLAQRGFSRKAANAALEALAERGIVDDRRYAALWARHRAERKGEGPATVTAELRARGFRPDDIGAALSEIDFGPALAIAVQKETAKLAAMLRKRGRGDEDESGSNGDILRDSLRRNLRKQGFDADLIREEIDKNK
jgi:regulatory protein